MSNNRPIHYLSWLISIAVLLMAASPSMGAPLTSSGIVPLTGTVYDPTTGSQVTLNASIHLVTEVEPGQPNVVTVFADLPGDSGTTADTGLPYQAFGRGHILVVTDDLSAVPSPTITGFNLTTVPPGPNGYRPFAIQVHLGLTPEGALNTSGTSAAVSVVTGPQ
jgi:hypothetical protein